MVKVYLIRHGDIEYPRDEEGRPLVYGPDTPLSVNGRIQIQQLSERLQYEEGKIDALFVSPYLRARESAQIISQQLSIPTTRVIQDLRDVDNPDWIGIPLEEYGKLGGDIYANPKSPRQETLGQLVERAKRAITEILGPSPHHTIGIVSHGDLLSALVWFLKFPDMPPSSYLEMKTNSYLKKGEAYQCKIDNSVRLVKEGRLITVEGVNRSIEKWR